MAAQGQALAPEQRCATGPTRSWPSAAAGAGTPAGRLGAGAAGLPQVPQLQRLLEGLRGGAPGGDSPQCRARRPGRPRIWRSAGTKPCASALRASSARPSPSPRKTGGTRPGGPTGSSSSTTSHAPSSTHRGMNIIS